MRSITMDEAYLQRGLTRRVESAKEAFIRDIESMMATLAARGMLGSGTTLRMFGEISLKSLTDWFTDAAQFAFTVTGRHEGQVVAGLDSAANALLQAIYAYLQQRLKNTGLPDNVVLRQLDSIHTDLLNQRTALIDDFEHGIQGSEKLKKDPVVSVVAHQSNSPEAVQQIGSGAFSQSAFVQNYTPLIQAIETAVNSDEFRELSPEQQVAFTDVADTFKDEAAKSQPDVGKLKRWGNRLLNLSTDFGMKVAASTLAGVLTRIFVG